MTRDLKKILELAVNAPSGDNSQPWRFGLRDGSIDVYNVPEEDDSLYNYQQRGSFIAHGALLENILIAASQFGYETELRLFPGEEQSRLVARVSVKKGSPGDEPLFPYIAKRTTNRKPYESKPILPEHRSAIMAAARSERAGFRLLEDQEKIKGLAKALCLNERLILENYHIHRGLFAFIRWTKEQEREKQNGLYIKTLELKLPQERAFKLFSHWPVINFLSKLGIPKLVARDSAKLYASTPAYGIILAQDASPETFVGVGRTVQRIWLAATKHGLSLQPTAGLLYLAQRVNDSDTKYFSQTQVREIKTADAKIREVFDVQGALPAMLFRLGYSEPPSAHSLKRAPVILDL